MRSDLVFVVVMELALCGLCFAADAAPASDGADVVSQALVLAPGANNPRNSPGDFVHLKDGKVLFVYVRSEGTAREPAGSRLVSRVSSDDGQHWSDRDEPILATPKDAK